MIAVAERARASIVTADRIAIAGLGLDGLAAWIALPPVAARSLFWPVIFAGAGMAAGVLGYRAGSVRLGWSAIMLSPLCFGLAYLATLSGMENLEQVFTWSTLIASMFVWATPLIFASIGGLYSERSGVVNIGLEGMMLMGAFFGIWGADVTGSWITGVLIAMAAGGFMGLLHAFFSVHLRADQIVGGTAINFLAVGITGYFFIQLYGAENIPAGVSEIPRVHLDFLKHIPPHASWLDLGSFLDKAFGNLSLMIWIAVGVVVLTHVVIFKTAIGLRIRSVGEHPRAAATVGISVYGVRYGAVTLSGVLAGAGGAFLSVGVVSTFSEGMTGGRGFIALAALIFGNWRAFGAFGASLFFGFWIALAFRLQVYSESLPGIEVLVQMLPYVFTLFAVAGVVGRSIPPAADGKPYVKQ